MKKILISLILILALCPMGSFADEMAFQQFPVQDSFVPLGGASISAGNEIPSAFGDYPAFFGNFTFEDYLCAVVLESETLPAVIDGLEQFNINKSEFADVYFDIVLKHPELFLKTGYTSLRYNEETGDVQSFIPKYLISSAEEAAACRKILSDGIKEYTDVAEGYATLLEKLLVIHDKMVAECDYDINVLNKNTESLVPDSAYHAIGVFRDEVAVCQGYSQALYIIAKELGIEMDFCYSEEKNHMWNYVKLDGKWYHLDLTNDDPVEKDENGVVVPKNDPRAYHIFFMVSESGLKENIHGNDYRSFSGIDYNCNDSSYETDYIFNIDVPFMAIRDDDGFYRVEAELTLVSDGVTIPVQFVNKKLRIGAAASVLSSVQVTSDTKLYWVCYATKSINNASVINRYDNKNSISRADNVGIEKDTFGVISIAANVPDNMGISFTTFLWDMRTLVPFAEKAVWSQN